MEYKKSWKYYIGYGLLVVIIFIPSFLYAVEKELMSNFLEFFGLGFSITALLLFSSYLIKQGSKK